MKRSTRRKRSKTRFALDLTPMVDVVFQLLIFFMITMKFVDLQAGLPVDLPQAQSAEQQSPNLPTVTVKADQQVFIGDTLVEVDGLKDALAQVMSEQGSDIVVLRADANVTHGMTVQVMDQIKQSGVRRVAIAATNQ